MVSRFAGGIPAEVAIATFIMLTRVSVESLYQPKSFATLERHVMDHLHSKCPTVKWIKSYAVFGPHDYVDIFSAPDLETAMQVSILIRSYGRAQSEVWPAFDWPEFKSMVRGLEQGAAGE